MERPRSGRDAETSVLLLFLSLSLALLLRCCTCGDQNEPRGTSTIHIHSVGEDSWGQASSTLDQGTFSPPVDLLRIPPFGYTNTIALTLWFIAFFNVTSMCGSRKFETILPDKKTKKFTQNFTFHLFSPNVFFFFFPYFFVVIC